MSGGGSKVTSGGGRTERLLHLLAALACLVFALGLSDAARVELVAPQLAANPLIRVVARVEQRKASPSEPGPGEGGARAAAAPPEFDAVPGAELWFHRERQGQYEYVAQETTNAQGEAAVSLPAGRYWVVARAAGRARSARFVELWENRALRVELLPEARLAVSVQSDGVAVPNASVLVEGRDALPAARRSDAAGEAIFDELFAGPYRVRVAAPGYEPFEATTSGDITVRLTRTVALRVLVRDELGKPTSGAQVTLSGPGLWPARSVTTGPDGSVLVSGLSRGMFDVVARDRTRISDTLRSVYLSAATSPKVGPFTVELVLRPGRFVDVDVVDESGQAVADAEVVVADAGVSQFPLLAESDVKGRARLGPMRAQRTFLAVRADGFVPRSLWIEAEVLGRGEPVRVELVRGATLSGRVVDERGFPVEAVALEVIGTDLYGMPVAMTPQTTLVRKRHFAEMLSGPLPLIPAGELGVMPGPVPPIPLAAGAVPVPGQIESWTTGGDGRFVARGVSPGELRVLARHPEYVESVSEAVRLGPGGHVEVEIVMRAGRRVEGRLLDAQGFPVAGVRVRLTAVRGAFDRTLLTGADGSFVVAVAPRELIVSIYGVDDPLRVVLRKTVKLTDSASERLALELPEPRPEVKLRVVDERDQPVVMAQVTVLSLDPETPLRETRFSSNEGEVNVLDAAGIHARVLVEAPGFAQFERSFAALPEGATLALGRSVTVVGRATTVRGRQPASGARVVLEAPGMRRETVTDEFGAFSLGDVAPGRVSVTIEHRELGRATVEATVKRDDLGRPFELPAVDLERQASVRGRVVSARGEPVAGARVAVGIVPLYLPQGALPEGVAVTDGRGEFVLASAPPGKQTLSAYSRTSGRGSLSGVVLEAGAERADVEIKLTEPPDAPNEEFRGGVAVTLGEHDAASGTLVVVVQVAESSEARRGGLVVGDVIVAVDGTSVRSMGEARALLGGPAATDVVVSILRDKARKELRVTRESVNH